MATGEAILLDGGMGTMLQAAGLPGGQAPELWNLTAPERVTAVHRRYAEAGSRVLYTNTFGANRFRAGGAAASVEELVRSGVRCARAAAGQGVRVALDVGPLGRPLAPRGTLSFREAYDAFAQVVSAGAAAGADLVVIETMGDLQETEAAVRSARDCSGLPVWVTMSFDASGRSYAGATVAAMAAALRALEVEAMGFNCSAGPDSLLPLVEELRRRTDTPLILKPSAGLPDPATGAYPMTPADFAQKCAAALDSGVTYFGGCCGTTPDFIAALAQALGISR